MGTFEIPLGNAPRVGQDLHLVRWAHTPDGWSSQTVLVTYISSTPDTWVVRQQGLRTTLSRSDWLPFAL